MPDPPKQSFFKGFFGGGTKQLDRNELFGESKASSSMAVVTQGDAMKNLTVRRPSNKLSRATMPFLFCVLYTALYSILGFLRRQTVSAEKVKLQKLRWLCVNEATN